MTSVVRTVTGAVDWFFDLLMAPFATMPALGLVVISTLTAVWALLLFKAVTPQAKLDTTRDRLFGHIYEMGLYQDHLAILARIQGSLAKANLRYLGFTLPALVALTLPMILTLGQMEGRFAHRPLMVGESTVLTVEVAEENLTRLGDLRLQVPEGLEISAGPVRNTRTGTLAWRLKALEEGSQELQFVFGSETAGSYGLQVGSSLPGLHNKTESSVLGLLLYPGSLQVNQNTGLKGMTLQWPVRTISYLGLEMHWLLAFMVFSMIAGLLLKDPLKVSF